MGSVGVGAKGLAVRREAVPFADVYDSFVKGCSRLFGSPDFIDGMRPWALVSPVRSLPMLSLGFHLARLWSNAPTCFIARLCLTIRYATTAK